MSSRTKLPRYSRSPKEEPELRRNSGRFLTCPNHEGEDNMSIETNKVIMHTSTEKRPPEINNVNMSTPLQNGKWQGLLADWQQGTELEGSGVSSRCNYSS